MPIYEYQCDCGEEKQVILSFAECNQPQTCKCGKVMPHKMSVPMPAIFTPTGQQMALDTLNSKQRGMPDRWWKPKAQQLAASGL